MTEGAGRRCEINAVGDLVGIAQDAHGGVANHLDILSAQIRRSLDIALRRIAHAMGLAVDLDREAACRTVEIDDVPANRMLPSKDGIARNAPPQSLPQQDLGQRHPPPQRLGQSMRLIRRSHQPNISS